MIRTRIVRESHHCATEEGVRLNNESITPQLPFVWPEPRVSAGLTRYADGLPFESALRASTAVFGVVSAIDDRAVEWMESFLAARTETKLRLVFSLHPTCRTTEAILQNAVRLTERHGERVAFKVYPETSVEHRSSNLLCLCGNDGSLTVSTGSTENLGYAPVPPSHANLATQVHASAFEACRKWFDYLWGVAGLLREEAVPIGWEALRQPRLGEIGDIGGAPPVDQAEVDRRRGVVKTEIVCGEFACEDMLCQHCWLVRVAAYVKRKPGHFRAHGGELACLHARQQN